MPRHYGIIEANFWNNRHVRKLSREARVLLLYLFTCRHGNSAGCFVLPDAYAAADLGFTVQEVTDGFVELLCKPFVERDSDTEVVRLIGWFGHNVIDNPNIAKNVCGWILSLPDCEVKSNCIRDLKRRYANKAGNVGKTIRDVLGQPIRTQEPEQEQEQEPDSSRDLADRGEPEKFSDENQTPPPNGHVNGHDPSGDDAPSRLTKCPEDFEPDASDYKFGGKLGLDAIAVMRTVPEFVSYWRGVGKRHADWHQTFRNRLTQVADRKKPSGPEPRESPFA